MLVFFVIKLFFCPSSIVSFGLHAVQACQTYLNRSCSRLQLLNQNQSVSSAYRCTHLFDQFRSAPSNRPIDHILSLATPKSFYIMLTINLIIQLIPLIYSI